MSDTLFEEQIEQGEIEIPSTLPVLPLKETVVFPQSVSPLAIGQERSVKLVDDVVAGERMLALVTVKNPEADPPGWDDLHEIGTAAVVHKMIRVPDGSLRILVQGVGRIQLERHVQDEPYLVGEFTEVPDVVEETPELEALVRSVQNEFGRLISLVPYLPSELELAAANVDEPSALSHLVASTLRLKTEEKQGLLEQPDVSARLRGILAILGRELEVVELGSKIQSQVQSEMEKGQREFFLRQQLKAIQDELGEGDDQQAEINELRGQMEEKNLPEDARKAVERELARLEKLPPAAAEYGVIRTYLDWILSLPWNETTEDNLDLAHAREVLDDDHYDLEKVKDRILEYLAVPKLKNDLSGPILCFVGPPGVGKTSLGQSIARTTGRKFMRISVGGVHDEAEIRGHRRTYIGAMPGTIIRSLRDAESKNPVLLIDEIDKMGADFRGDPASAMLEVLDPEQNKHFRDHYLDLPFDLSKVLFICTANLLETIPGPLLDRMDVLQLSGYTEDEKLGIARKYLVPKQLEAHGLSAEQLKLDDDVLRLVIARVHARGGRPQPRAPDRRPLPQGRPRDRGGSHRGRRSRRDHGPRMARPAALPGRPAQAHGRPWCRHRPGVDPGRRRRPLHRGDRVPRQGQAHDHRPARRGDAGVRPGRALLGSRQRDAARRARELVRGARRPHPRPGRRRAEGRALGGDHDRDRDRLARARQAGRRGRRHDRRDHAHRPGAADRRRPREGARRAAGRAEADRPAARQRARSRGTARRDPRGARVHPGRRDRRGFRRRLRRGQEPEPEGSALGRAAGGATLGLAPLGARVENAPKNAQANE